MELTTVEEEKPASKMTSVKMSSDESKNMKTLDKGWSWIVLLSSFGTFFIVGANILGVGIMHVVLLERYRESVSLTSLASSLQTAFTCFGGMSIS